MTIDSREFKKKFAHLIKKKILVEPIKTIEKKIPLINIVTDKKTKELKNG